MEQNKVNQPLMVTIRCLTYNHEPYIRQCLEGFVMQRTNFKFEAIVHDDASTDGTAAIIKEYAEKYPDVIKPILETENQYSKHDGSLRRIMNEACKGKYIAFCEGDDYWTDPLKLQKQVDLMEAHPEYSMCCSKAKLYSQTKERFIGEQKCRNHSAVLRVKDIVLRGGLYIPTCSILLRHELYDSLGYQEPYIRRCHVGDYPLQMYMAMQGKVFYFDEFMAVYRVDCPNSWVWRNNHDVLTESKIKGYISEIEMLEGFSKDYPKYRNFFITRMNYYISCQYRLNQTRETVDLLDKAFAKYYKYNSLFWKMQRFFRVHGTVSTKKISEIVFRKAFRLYEIL